MMTSAPSSPIRFDGAGTSVVIRRSPLTRPAFCEAGLVEPAHVQAVEHRSRGDDLGDVTTPVPPIPTIRRSRSRWDDEVGIGEIAADDTRVRLFLGLRIGRDLDETGAVALQARVVEIAARLIDRGLGAERVSIACTDRRFDTVPQSPHASQMRWLIAIR